MRTFSNMLTIPAFDLDVLALPAVLDRAPLSGLPMLLLGPSALTSDAHFDCAINLPWISSHALRAVPCAASKPPCTGFKGTYHIAGHLVLS